MGKNYGYFSVKEGYYSTSKNIDLRQITEPLKFTENIEFVTTPELVIKPMRINNIFFALDKYDLKRESRSELNRLAEFLKGNQDFKVEISGHTDSQGSEGYNLELSQKRAQAVVGYLVAVGCNPKMLTARGFGEYKPIASNETREGRQKNRRVEFRVVEATARK